jgi:hypothetical protein
LKKRTKKPLLVGGFFKSVAAAARKLKFFCFFLFTKRSAYLCGCPLFNSSRLRIISEGDSDIHSNHFMVRVDVIAL